MHHHPPSHHGLGVSGSHHHRASPAHHHHHHHSSGQAHHHHRHHHNYSEQSQAPQHNHGHHKHEHKHKHDQVQAPPQDPVFLTVPTFTTSRRSRRAQNNKRVGEWQKETTIALANANESMLQPNPNGTHEDHQALEALEQHRRKAKQEELDQATLGGGEGSVQFSRRRRVGKAFKKGLIKTAKVALLPISLPVKGILWAQGRWEETMWGGIERTAAERKKKKEAKKAEKAGKAAPQVSKFSSSSSEGNAGSEPAERIDSTLPVQPTDILSHDDSSGGAFHAVPLSPLETRHGRYERASKAPPMKHNVSSNHAQAQNETKNNLATVRRVDKSPNREEDFSQWPWWDAEPAGSSNSQTPLPSKKTRIGQFQHSLSDASMPYAWASPNKG